MSESTDLLKGLTQFQRNTVDHVIDRFYGTDPTDRFLVADQTGLGKTWVARGVVARTIEILQERPGVDRIDIVYICPSADLAAQNLRKLNVGNHHAIPSRLTLLARHSRRFPPIVTEGRRAVNLVSFTPSTSFKPGWATGQAEERALIVLLLEREASLGLSDPRRHDALLRLMQASVSSLERFDGYVEYLRAELGGVIDEAIVKAFVMALHKPAGEGASLLERVSGRVDEVSRGGKAEATWQLIRELRTALATASLTSFTPDLVILDEFQRFRELLDIRTDAGQLAEPIFNATHTDGPRPKVLLLSATPFKSFTLADETADRHQQDFLEVINFLGDGDPTNPRARVERALADYREQVVTGRLDATTVQRARSELLRVMVRTERPIVLDPDHTSTGDAPDIDADIMRTEVLEPLQPPTADEMLDYVALNQLSQLVKGQVSIEYWKSAPYFVNFMGGYKLDRQVKAALTGDDAARQDQVRQALLRARSIDAATQASGGRIDMGNPRLRHLAERTVGQGWWQLLWMTPSMPYTTPAGPFAQPGVAGMSKLLIFSAWTATPAAVASLLSHEAQCLLTEAAGEPESDRARHNPLAYRWDAARERFPGTTMSNLALFWPFAGLAEQADPLAHRREARHELTTDELRERVQATIVDRPVSQSESGPAATAWFELFSTDADPGLGLDRIAEVLAPGTRAASEPAEADDDTDTESGQNAHRLVAFAAGLRGADQDRPLTSEVMATIADVAAHSPANTALRALRRVVDPSGSCTRADVWAGAARLASGLRTLFSRPDNARLLDHLYPDEGSYWRRVLRYCADGNLQAVLDEYLYQLASADGGPVTEPHRLEGLVTTAVEAMTLRAARYGWFDPQEPDERRTFMPRFALRYGGRDEGDNQRSVKARQAFNSPFWPFVLASTSVGQEGIDFHWWCHALLHWNVPPNPVDFEQREGRIDRHDGLAVRRNVAAAHRDEVLRHEGHPWEVAYQLASQARPDLGAFAPHWVYPGPARIERHVAPMPLSVDEARLARVKKDAALYRLTFGQPRQEDLLQVIKGQLKGPGLTADRLRIDLSAPASHAVPPVPE